MISSRRIVDGQPVSEREGKWIYPNLSMKQIIVTLSKVINDHLGREEYPDSLEGRSKLLRDLEITEKLDNNYILEKFAEKFPSLVEEAHKRLQKLHSENEITVVQEISRELSDVSTQTYKLPYCHVDDTDFFLIRMKLGSDEVQSMFFYDKNQEAFRFLDVQDYKFVESARIEHDPTLTPQERVQRLKELDKKENYSFFKYNGKEIKLKSYVSPIKSGLAFYYPDFSKINGELYSEKETFQAIENLVEKFFNHVDPRVYNVIASFPIISFFSYMLGWSPYLFLTSTSGGTGKSNVLKLLSHLSSNGAYFSAGTRIRALARMIDLYRLTVAIDEIDKQADVDFRDISGILNSGSEDSGSGYVITDTNDLRNVIVFDCFGTKYLAGNRYDVLADSTLSRTVLIMCVKADRNIPRFTGKIEQQLEPEFNKIRCSILRHVLKHKDELLSLVEQKIQVVKSKYTNMDRGVETAALISAIIEYFSSPEDALDVEEYLVKQIAAGMSYSLNEVSDAIIRAVLDGALNGEFEREGGRFVIPIPLMVEKANSFLPDDQKLKKRTKRISNLLRKLNCLEDTNVIKDENNRSVKAYVVSLSRLWVSLKREPVYTEIVSDYSDFFSNDEPKPSPFVQSQVVEEHIDSTDDRSKIRDSILSELREKGELDLDQFVRTHSTDFLIDDIELVVEKMKQIGEIFEPKVGVLRML